MTLADGINIALTAVIAFAAIMQWRVAANLKAIESSREKTRLPLRFVHGDDNGVAVRVANLSSFGVFIERVECVITAKYKEYENNEEFVGTRIWRHRAVLPAFGDKVFEAQDAIVETISGRNAAFSCDLEAKVVYINGHGKKHVTSSERTMATIRDRRFTGYQGE